MGRGDGRNAQYVITMQSDSLFLERKDSRYPTMFGWWSRLRRPTSIRHASRSFLGMFFTYSGVALRFPAGREMKKKGNARTLMTLTHRSSRSTLCRMR